MTIAEVGYSKSSRNGLFDHYTRTIHMKTITFRQGDVLLIAVDEIPAAAVPVESATVELETLRAKRQRAEIVIDVWRSLEASRRKS